MTASAAQGAITRNVSETRAEGVPHPAREAEWRGSPHGVPPDYVVQSYVRSDRAGVLRRDHTRSTDDLRGLSPYGDPVTPLGLRSGECDAAPLVRVHYQCRQSCIRRPPKNAYKQGF